MLLLTIFYFHYQYINNFHKKEGVYHLMPVRKGIKLRFAISLLVIMTLFCTILVSWYTSAKALKDTLTDNYLENNYKYANKLSLSTGDLLTHMQLTINGMAKTLGHKKINQELLDERREALSDYFNSLFIVDSQGVIQLISPSIVNFDLEIKNLKDHKIPFTMIMIDIDRFKKVNDTYGHLVGDDVLKYLSHIIEHFTSEDDLCFRYGGEEFGILLKDKNTEDAFHVAEQLRIMVAETISPSGESITISIGISSSRDEDQHPEEIIKRADTALFQSKTDGRNRTTCYNETCDVVLSS